MKFQIFLQARMGSTRLPGKALLKICDKTMIELIVERLGNIKGIDRIVLATGEDERNKELLAEAKRLGIDSFRGSEENVLDRLYQAALIFQPDVIIRVTGDCPLIDSNLISEGIKVFKDGGYDVVSNARIRSYPDGLDYDIFNFKSLKEAWQKESNKIQDSAQFNKTFISPAKRLYQEKNLQQKDIVNEKNLAEVRLTLDHPEDFEVIKTIYEKFYGSDKNFGISKVLKFLEENPRLLEINKKHICLNY